MAMIEDDGIELELGLSLGGNYSTRLQKSAPGSADFGSGFSGQDLKNRREVHALRRLEAKKKRDEKQLKRALSKGKLAAAYFNGAGGGGGCGAHGEAEEPDFKKSKVGIARSDSVSGPGLQLGFGQNGMTPAWFVVAGGGTERNVIRPVARYGFRGAFGNDTELNVGGGVGSNGSTVCTSSAGSDTRSSSREGGGSIDSRTNSNQSTVLEHPRSLNPCSANLVKSHPEHPIEEEDPRKPKEESKSDNEGTTNNTSSVENPDPTTESKEAGQLPPRNPALPYMPCVSTTGTGPNGKTVHGFLYRYAKGEEVSIICVCHGSSFSPGEFVQHAGGVDVSHPLKHITVVPSAL
ncbi:Ninja-family protein AFP3 [Linum perenne]